MTTRRITDHVSTGLLWIGAEYASVSCFNADGTRLLLQHSGGLFGLYDGQGAFLKTTTLLHGSEPRWSRTDPTALYYVYGNELRSCRPETDNHRHVLKAKFIEYVSISGRGESDISDDGDHFVFAGTRPDGVIEVFVFEVSTRTKQRLHVMTEPFDGLKISSDNQAIVSRSPKDENDKDPEHNGIWVLEEAGPRRICPANGHAAIGRDTNGDAILVWANADEKPEPSLRNGVVKIRISDGQRTDLLSLDPRPEPWVEACNISLPARGGPAYVSSYGRNEPSGKLYAARLDGSGAEIVADGINSNVTDYGGQPKASISRDGKKLVYNRDGDVYMVDLANQLSSIPQIIPESAVRVDSRNMANKQFLFEPNGTGDWKLTEITK